MESLSILKKYIHEIATRKEFLHHEWFIEHHIQIAELIALELCELYPEADSELVLGLIWFHDYGKIIDMPHEHEATQSDGRLKLLELGFDEVSADKILAGIRLIDEKTHLEEADIEVRIASSADGASHMLGPFYPLYWREFHHIPLVDLLAENNRKLDIDWNMKIVLPEIRTAFKWRYDHLKEMFGSYPVKFLKQESIVK